MILVTCVQFRPITVSNLVCLCTTFVPECKYESFAQCLRRVQPLHWFLLADRMVRLFSFNLICSRSKSWPNQINKRKVYSAAMLTRISAVQICAFHKVHTTRQIHVSTKHNQINRKITEKNDRPKKQSENPTGLRVCIERFFVFSKIRSRQLRRLACICHSSNRAIFGWFHIFNA